MKIIKRIVVSTMRRHGNWFRINSSPSLKKAIIILIPIFLFQMKNYSKVMITMARISKFPSQ